MSEKSSNPNPYLTVTSQGYTKHYYANGERLASVIGHGGWYAMSSDPIDLPSPEEKDKQELIKTQYDYTYPLDHKDVYSITDHNEDIEGVEQDKIQYDCVCNQLSSINFTMKPDVLFLTMETYTYPTGYPEDEIYYTHNDHLGSAAWITDKYSNPVQYMHYLPYGQLLANQKATTYDERYKFIGKERDWESGYDYFGARYYISPFLHWMSVDPLSDEDPGISPYAYCAWNPLKYVDPKGEWIAVVSNDDTGTSYKVVGGTVDVDDCNVYVVGNDYNAQNDEKPNNTAILGQTATPYSFCNEKGEVISGSTINMNDKSGDAFIAKFQNNEISLFRYIFDSPQSEGNQSGRNYGNCDFKYGADPNRGMPLSILAGKIGTARDVGNFAAGYLAARKYIPYGATMQMFDIYQNIHNKTTSGEPLVSRWAQMLGFGYGLDARRAVKFNRTNIYNAYR